MKTTHYLQTLIGEDCSKFQALMGKGARHRTAVLVKTHDTAIKTFPFSSEHVSLIHFYFFPAFSYVNILKKAEPVSSLTLGELLHFKHLSQRAEYQGT